MASVVRTLVGVRDCDGDFGGDPVAVGSMALVALMVKEKHTHVQVRLSVAGEP